MQKIIYINSVNLNETTGQGSFERNFISYLENNSDIEKTMYSIDDNKNYKDGDIQYIKLNKKSKKSYIIYQIYIFYFLFLELLRSDKKNTFIYIRLAPYNIVPFLLGKLFNIKITTRSGPVYQNLLIYKKVNSKIILYIYKKLLNYYYRNSSKIIVVTNKIKENLVNDFNIDKKNIEVIPNPINDEIFNKTYNNDFLLKKYNLKNEVIFGYVGSLYKEQGVLDIVKAFNILINKHYYTNLKLFIVGNGLIYTELKEKIKNYNLSSYVIMTGNIDIDKIPEYISNVDVCFATYTNSADKIKGSSALKVMEYLFYNKYIIAADILDYQFIEENNFGLLYKVDNYESLANTIIKYLKKDIDTQNSKSFVIENRTKKIIFDKYINTIKE